MTHIIVYGQRMDDNTDTVHQIKIRTRNLSGIKRLMFAKFSYDLYDIANNTFQVPEDESEILKLGKLPLDGSMPTAFILDDRRVYATHEYAGKTLSSDEIQGLPKRLESILSALSSDPNFYVV